MTDTFKKNYKPLHPKNSEMVLKMKEAFEFVEKFMGRVNNREMSIAKTNLEQASMWATKAVCIHDEYSGGKEIEEHEG